MNKNSLPQLLFATNNAHKLEEVKAILGHNFEILSLADKGIVEDVPETAPTFAGNALLKARTISEKYGLDCMADDSGLEVEALNGEPGIYSARYAGELKNDEANLQKVLVKLSEKTNREARFVTVVALVRNGLDYVFEGEVKGQIIREKRGVNGFGYDPIFVPEGFEKTFAELSSEEKNAISHRSRAVAKLSAFLAD